MKSRPIAAALIAAMIWLLAANPVAARQAAPYTVVETGEAFARLQDAVDAIGNGSGTIRFASMRFADCAVQKSGEIAYVAAVPGRSVLDGVPCQGKAALVLAGRSARIEGLVFANIRVPDRNGAGIRLERGSLAITQSWFRDSEQGILANSDPKSSITIDKSTFTRLGTCAGSGGCAHSVYVGDYGALTITRTRFEQGRGGHYVKYRGRRIDLRDSSFDDTGGLETNYMVDLPNGSTGKISGNWFVQGRHKDNHSALIVIGAKEKWRSSKGLAITGNVARFAPGARRPSNFVVDFTGDAIVIADNQIDEELKRLELR